MKQLSQEERDLLASISQHPGVEVLLKMAGFLVSEAEHRVISFNLMSGDVAGLVALKSQAEGAAKLLANLTITLGQIKNESLQDRRVPKKARGKGSVL